jgi:hypothetical protein
MSEQLLVFPKDQQMNATTWIFDRSDTISLWLGRQSIMPRYEMSQMTKTSDFFLFREDQFEFLMQALRPFA